MTPFSPPEPPIIPPLDTLIDSACSHTMTDAEREEQRKSFARGNVGMSQEEERRTMVADEAIVTVAEASTDHFGITPCQLCGGKRFILFDDVHLGTAYNGDPIITTVKQSCPYCSC